MDSDDRYIAVILDQPALGPEWKSRLTVEMSLRGVLLRMDGYIEEDGIIFGRYRFVEREETEQLVQAARVEVPARHSLWAGPIRGAIEWILVGLGPELLRTFIPLLVEWGRGPFIRMRDGACHHPLQMRTFGLDQLLEKRGFNDGAAFLSEVPGYLDSVCEAINVQLKSAGLNVQVYTMDTIHNPLRLRGPFLRNGREVSEDILYELSVEIWAYDWKCLDDKAFW